MEEAVLANLVGDSAEAEVEDLEIAVLVEQEILGLEVAVEDATGVAESDGGDQLLEVKKKGKTKGKGIQLGRRKISGGG